MSTPRLPHFERPPVGEVVLGVVFEPLLRLRASHLGVFWTELNADGDFPLVDEFRPSRLVIEKLPSSNELPLDDVELSITDQEPLPRVVVSSSDCSHQVAIQRDLLQVTWRRTGDGGYPRFEDPKELFDETLARFQKFLADRKLGRLRLRQAEVSYVNLLPVRPEKVQEDTESLVNFKLVTGTNLIESDHFHLFQRHTLSSDGDAWARLYITVDSEGQDGLSLADFETGEQNGSRLGLSVQGPVGNFDQMEEFVEKAHQVIIKTFDNTMTPMGEIAWGKIEESS